MTTQYQKNYACWKDLYNLVNKQGFNQKESAEIAGNVESMKNFAYLSSHRNSAENSYFKERLVNYFLLNFNADLKETGYKKIFDILWKYNHGGNENE